ncbi:MAG: NUDIX hydrolase [Bacteroidia bacterium]|nr:NUDIX hydrolase [Bacteroidia bacterium]MBP6649219.1 NUDIX hydrolase [Bacteroidia bacterium]
MKEKSEYKVFVNDKPFVIREIYQPSEKDETEGIQIISESSVSLEKAIGDLERNKKWKQVNYLTDSPLQTWKQMVSQFTLIEAAGGLVQKNDDSYLVIFRRGKWDLPKGKLDYDESPEQAALREVEEECGISKLRILKPLPTTFHTYPEGGRRILKKTHWYLMESDDNRKLIPQAEEDIQEALWMSETEIKTKVFSNTYNSIQDLLVSFFNSPQNAK